MTTPYINTSNLYQTLTRLRRTLGKIETARPTPLSLAPGGQYATPPEVLCETLLRAETNSRLVEYFVQGIGRIVLAQAQHFPDNIFGDLDFLAAELLTQARKNNNDLTYLERAFALIVEVNQLFGVHSPIRFRYAHDFLYGFDWSRWVRQKPQVHQHHSPFSLKFLVYLKRRAGELLELIRHNDIEYPALPADQTRNIFAFPRTPASEIQLHHSLADDQLIPVPAWDPSAVARWDFDCNQLRQEHALALGLSAMPSGS